MDSSDRMSTPYLALPPGWHEGDPHPYDGRIFLGPGGARVTFGPRNGIKVSDGAKAASKSVLSYARQTSPPPSLRELETELLRLGATRVQAETALHPDVGADHRVYATAYGPGGVLLAEATERSTRDALMKLVAELEGRAR